MKYLSVDCNYNDPELSDYEIVERKGLGHPDSLADGIANLVSIEYSKYCLKNFGHVLHHNVDKVYIGGGMFLSDFGSAKMVEPISVVINGRMSDRFGKSLIDVKKIQRDAAKKYLSWVLPELDATKDVVITPNASQNMPNISHPYWYRPRGVEDLPEIRELQANDTSVIASYSPLTMTERLVLAIEKYFWVFEGNSFRPKFKDLGQDIKVMGERYKTEINIILCVPVLAKAVFSEEQYYSKISAIEKKLTMYAKEIVGGSGLKVHLKVNPMIGPKPKIYILGAGSCIEGGEEGLVGRGNDYRGIISMSRPHIMEAPFGKNPVYHSGRVLSCLTSNLADAITKKLGAKCTVIAMTRNHFSLVPPSRLIIKLDKKIDRKDILAVIKKDFLGVDYILEILKKTIPY